MPGAIDLDAVALAEIVGRTLVVYVALLVGLRLAGKRELGQMSAFDLVVILVISNAVQNAMVGANTSLTGGLVAATTLLAVNALLVRTGLHSRWLRKRFLGSPTLLVHEGELMPGNLRHEGLETDEVMQALREHGIDDLHKVKSAILEVDGSISVIPTTAASTRTKHRIGGRKPPR
jgi:uncharacterized membrane protein YcaP (DUF421 family)